MPRPEAGWLRGGSEGLRQSRVRGALASKKWVFGFLLDFSVFFYMHPHTK